MPVFEVELGRFVRQVMVVRVRADSADEAELVAGMVYEHVDKLDGWTPDEMAEHDEATHTVLEPPKYDDDAEYDFEAETVIGSKGAA